ncbi:MAG: chemotaxis protein CheW [Gammaproteobacteria bacterium]|nr:chemotaxis protein CheW [Gammaproteobacteria bacterium]
MSLPVSSKSLTPAQDVETQGEESQYLTFSLGKEMFAIGILNIKEILEFGQLTPVPMMPGFIRGVINLRGAVVPVIDLGARFGGQQSEITKRTCIVIIEVTTEEGHQDIGVVVDAVSEVLEIPDEEIEPAPAFGARIRADFIASMGKVNGKFVIILNVNKVLSVDELAMVSQVSEEAGAR